MAKKKDMMYLIIVGAGRIGSRIIEMATGDDHEVVVIESDAELAEEASTTYDCLVINNDASKIDVLVEAGIEKADALISTTSDDSTNLLLMMLGKRYEVPRLLSSVREPDHIDLFKELDIDFVGSPHRLHGEYLYRAVQRPGIKDFMRLDGGAEIAEIELSKQSALIGQTISNAVESGLITKYINIVAIYRNSKLIIPRGDTAFQEDDTVIILSKVGIDRETIQTFKEQDK